MVYYRVINKVVSEDGHHLMFSLLNASFANEVANCLKNEKNVKRVSHNEQGNIFITTNPHFEYYDAPATTKSQYNLAVEYFNELITNILETLEIIGNNHISYGIGVHVERVQGLDYSYVVYLSKTDINRLKKELDDKDWVDHTFISGSGLKVDLVKSIIFYINGKRVSFDKDIAEKFILREVSKILAQ